MSPAWRDPVLRFFEKVRVNDETECWEWAGHTCHRGYGRFNFGSVGPNGKAQMGIAHRWAYEHLVGPIPDGLQLDHLCRNRRCVNPKHLEPVTLIENVRRGKNKNPEGRCRRGHTNLRPRSDGYLRCYECVKIAAAARRARRAAA